MTKAEIDVIWSHPMQGQRLPTKHQKTEEERRDSVTDLGTSTDLLTPRIWTFGLKDCEIVTINYLVLSHLFCGAYTAASGN